MENFDETKNETPVAYPNFYFIKQNIQFLKKLELKHPKLATYEKRSICPNNSVF